MTRALQILVVGIVQGVGFRPFIHRIAAKTGVKGFVRNVGGSEVEIYVEGDSNRLSQFLRLLKTEAPPPAVIEEITIQEVTPRGFKDFRILPSTSKVKQYSMIPPDIAICRHCLHEVLDPRNRRYKYPFNSCAWCGPRFSTMYTVPYDRENTSMKYFPLCSECLAEYRDINNVRRYHAQGICCSKCGPRVWLVTSDGRSIECNDPITEAAKLIDEGYIIAIKGLGGFHIASLASDDDIVLKLRKRKNRPQKPFAIMALNIEIASKLVYIDRVAAEILTSPQSPIILLPKREDTPVSPYVSPGLDLEGVFLPYTALHYLLLSGTRDKFLIMTSGNPHGKPMCIDEKCAFEYLSKIADYFLLHNREIVNRVDDSVLRFTDGEPVLLRRARGYAPTWIKLRFRLAKPAIAFGAELQTTAAIAFDNKVILTQYIGDVDDVDVLDDLRKYLEYFMKVYSINPCKAILVADRHPGYTSKKLAEYYANYCQSEIIEVQHHYAHALSVAVDRGLDPDDIGVAIAIDGIGYGDDDAIWGGEVLVFTYSWYKRYGHLMYHPLPGGDVTTKYPARMALSIMASFMDYEEVLLTAKRVGLINKLRGKSLEAELVLQQLSNSVLTSSMGRTLDAFSALLGICWERTYEGEPAMKLEAAAKGGKLIDAIKAPIRYVNNELIVDTSRLMESVLENLDKPLNNVAFSIQYSLGYSLGEILMKAFKEYKASYAVISGGAAVNNYIVRGVRDFLKNHGVKLELPRRVPVNDGGIALGQVAHLYKYLYDIK